MARLKVLAQRTAASIGVLLLILLALTISAAARQLQRSATMGSNGCSGSVPAGWVVLPGHLPPIMSQARHLHATDPSRQLALSISFRLRNQAAFEELLREQSTPGSPNYHKYLTPQEFQDRFGPTPAMIAQVQAFLTAQGLHLTRTLGQIINFTGSVRQAECAFAVQINDYQLGSRTVFAPASDPAVPASIAPYIAAILGLNNIAVAHPATPPTP